MRNQILCIGAYLSLINCRAQFCHFAAPMPALNLDLLVFHASAQNSWVAVSSGGWWPLAILSMIVGTI
jgi:hypothetical protein